MKALLLLLIPIALLGGCSESESEYTFKGVSWKQLADDPKVWYCINPETGDRVYIMCGSKIGGICVVKPDAK